MKTFDVLFICEANVGRSQIAEGYFNLFTGGKNAISAGIKDKIKKYGGKPAPEIIMIMKEDNIDISAQRIKVFSVKMIEQARNIVVLCRKDICPAPLLNSPKTKILSSKDPYKMSLGKTRKIRDEIKALVKRLLIEQNINFIAKG